MNVTNCIMCGRDTSNKSEVCSRCMKGVGKHTYKETQFEEFAPEELRALGINMDEYDPRRIEVLEEAKAFLHDATEDR